MRFHSYFIFVVISLTFLSSCSSPVIEGYTDQTSYNPSDTIRVYLNSEKHVEKHQVRLTDLGGKEWFQFTTSLDPQSATEESAFKNGFNFKQTFQFKIPEIPSGVYLLEDEIPFLIKPIKTPKTLILYSSNTENAYANSGGKSLYAYNSDKKIPSSIVSFQRPIKLPFHSKEFLEWVHTQDIGEVGYICDMDMDNYENIKDAELLIIPGHSEYWTRTARENFDRFITEGKNALIMSGNTMWWQVRYSNDGSQLVCYKSLKEDPTSDSLLITTNWTRPELDYPVISSIGLDFVHGGFGKNEDLGWDGFKITNPSSPIFKDQELKSGDVIPLPSDEYDGAKLDFSQGNIPELHNSMGFYKYELIGYDLGSRSKDSNGAWIVMQKSPSAGVIINVGSTDWCSKEGMKGNESELIQNITLRMIELLQANDPSLCFMPE